MAKRRPQIAVTTDEEFVELAELDELDRQLQEEAQEGWEAEEPTLQREVGTKVEEVAVPFEVRPDGSIAHFAHEAGNIQREMGS